jgi:hypothetical protein
MTNGEEEQEMPPNSTQNLNAKLSLTGSGSRHLGTSDLSFGPPPIQNSAPPVRIVGGPSRYQGGYHLSRV